MPWAILTTDQINKYTLPRMTEPMAGIHQQEVVTQSSDDNQNATATDVKPEPRGLRVLDRVIFAALLLIILLTSIPYGSVEPWWEAAFECSIFVLVGLWVCEGLWRGNWGVSFRGMFIPVAATVAYAIIQTLPLRSPGSGWPTISADPYTTRLIALKFLALACAGLLLARYTSSRRRLRALIFVIIATAVGSAIFGFIRETTQHNSPGFGLPQLMPGIGYGQFINRNHFAYLMEFGLGLALGLTVGKGEDRGRLLYIAAALPLLIGLVLTNSRGGVLSMFSQVLFLLLMLGAFGAGKGATESDSAIENMIRTVTSKMPVRVLLILCLLGAMVVGVLWIGGDPLTKRLETIKSEVSNEDADTGEVGGRKLIWKASWKVFKDHPVTGIGFGGYWIAITEYYDVPGQRRPYQAHNDYLELLVTGGLIGAALGIWLLIVFLRQVRETLRTKDTFRRAACIGALTGLFGIAVHSIVDFGLHITIIALIAVALIVIATIDKRVEASGAQGSAIDDGGRPSSPRRHRQGSSRSRLSESKRLPSGAA